MICFSIICGVLFQCTCFQSLYELLACGIVRGIFSCDPAIFDDLINTLGLPTVPSLYALLLRRCRLNLNPFVGGVGGESSRLSGVYQPKLIGVLLMVVISCG